MKLTNEIILNVFVPNNKASKISEGKTGTLQRGKKKDYSHCWRFNTTWSVIEKIITQNQ